MQFGFDDDQLSFRDAIRSVFAKGSRPEDVRAAWEDKPLDRRRLGRPGRPGVFGILAGEDIGGSGWTSVGWCSCSKRRGMRDSPTRSSRRRPWRCRWWRIGSRQTP